MPSDPSSAWLWIPITVFAALMQAVRTAAQKDLNRHLSTLGTTYVRSLFGLPFMAIYLAAVLAWCGGGWPDMNAVFLAHTLAGSIAQVVATALLVSMFRLRNFAVGTMLTKSDIILTALLGSWLFAETLTLPGWIALFVVLGGVLVMLLGRLGPHALTVADGGSVRHCGDARPRPRSPAPCSFILVSLLPRGHPCHRCGHFLWRGAWTVSLSLVIQTVLVGLWLAAREPTVFGHIRRHLGLSTFVGLTSALGSIGWFSAFALENAAYVRAVGQIEGVFTVSIAWFYFKERITRLEFGGILLTLAGVLMFRLAQ